MDLPRVRRQIRRARTPGIVPTKKWTLRNKRLHLTYLGLHIPKKEYREWIEVLEIAHETGDTAYSGIHTHVVISTSEPLRSEKEHALAWKYISGRVNLGDNNLIIPRVSILSIDDDYYEALYSLGDEDTENKSYHIDYEAWKPDIGPKRRKKLDLLAQIADREIADRRIPKHKMAHLRYWQLEVAELIFNAVDRADGLTNANFLWCSPESGVSTLINAIMYNHPHKFNYYKYKNGDRRSTCIPSELRDTFLFEPDLSWDPEGLGSLSTDILHSCDQGNCSNLWVFSSIVPDLSRLDHLERWKFYAAQGQWDTLYATGLMSIPNIHKREGQFLPQLERGS